MSKNFLFYLKKYSYLLGILLFAVILLKTNLKELWQNIKDIKTSYLIAALLLDFPMLLVKAWGWNYIKKQQGIRYRFKDSFLIYCAGLYLGGFTPGKLGEISKAFYLKKDGYSMGKSLVGVALDRLSDFSFLLAFIFFASLFFLNFIHKQILISLTIILIAIIVFLLFLKIGLIKLFIKKLFSVLIPQKYQKSWQIGFQDFVNDLKIYKFKNYLIIYAITIFSWLFYYLQMYLLAQATNITAVPFLYLAITVTIAGFIVLIPVSVSGIGTREVALTLMLIPFSISLAHIITFSALILLMYLFTSLTGLICWLIKPIKI